ncbi:tRNA (adenosine(37)-N6)-threonylcarbamoyltransferase complex ATPase subunit type 1 TsaE [Thermosulfuriphilus sp.]
MKNDVFITNSPEQTRALAQKMARGLKGGEVFLIFGDLGAGKTTFVQGLAEGLDVPGDFYVVSPSFSLINEYPGRLKLIHVDLYRLEPSQVEDLGLEDYFEKENVVVVEWAERIPFRLIPPGAVQITIHYLKDQSRRIEIIPPPKQHNP